jgi:hypothetical protein
MDGKILHIEENEEGLQYIRFEMRGAIIDVPAAMIDRYEDVIEPTSTQTPTPTLTPTKTETSIPTVTFTPFPTPTPFVVVVPPTPVGGRGGPAGGDSGAGGEPGGEWPDEPEVQVGGGDRYAEDIPLIGWLEERIRNAEERAEGPLRFLDKIAGILFIISWIVCFVDAFRQSASTGVLVLIFGAPCCCCVNYIVLIAYPLMRMNPEDRKLPLGLLIGHFLLGLLYTILVSI